MALYILLKRNLGNPTGNALAWIEWHSCKSGKIRL